MPFRIMPLEDRIVFDAAGVADTDPDDSPTPVAPVVLDAEPVAPPPEGSIDTDAPEPVLDTGGTLTEGASDAPVRVLVVSSAVEDAATLADAAVDGVHTLVYDAGNTSLDALLAAIEETLDGQQADSIAFAVHGKAGESFTLARNEVVSLATLNDQDQQEFWTELSQSVKADGRIDILACALTAGEDGQDLVAQLEDLTGRNVAASNDITGNADSGGDWVLETDDLDLAGTYFAASALGDFDGTLPWMMPELFNLYGDVSYAVVGGATAMLDAGQDAGVFDSDYTGYGGLDGKLDLTITSGLDAGHDHLRTVGGVAAWIAQNWNLVGGGVALTQNGTLIAAITGYDTGAMSINWTGNATDAHVRFITQRLGLNIAAGGAENVRELEYKLSDAENAWTSASLEVQVKGPIVANHSTNTLADGGSVTLTNGMLLANDADWDGVDISKIEYTILQDAERGTLWWDSDPTPAQNWIQVRASSANDSFTQQDIEDGRVKYIHNAGSAIFDRFFFEVSDSVNGETSARTAFFLDNAANNVPVIDLQPWNSGVDLTRWDYMNYDQSDYWMSWTNIHDDSYAIKKVTLTMNSQPDGSNEGLIISDVDRDRAALLYGIAITGGGASMTLTSINGTASVDTFQSALQNVRYWHTLIGRSPGYRDVSVVPNDGTSNGTTSHWYVYPEPDFGRPVVAHSKIMLYPMESKVLGPDYLLTTDSNTPAGSLIYTLNWLPWQGTLYLNGAPVWVGQTFTQQQVNEGRLTYKSTQEWAGWDQFGFEVTDGTTVTWGNMQLEIVPPGTPIWDPGAGFDPIGEIVQEFGEFGDEVFGDDFGDFGQVAEAAATTMESFGSESPEAEEIQTDTQDGDDTTAADEAAADARHGLDSMLDLFGAESDAANLFAGAVKAIKLAETLNTQSNALVDQTFDAVASFSAPVKEAVQVYIDEITASLVAMREAKDNLTQLLLMAQAAGDQFDKAYGDAVTARIADLTMENERVTISQEILNQIESALQRMEKEGEVDLEKLRRLAQEAQAQAQKHVLEIRARQDKADKDVVAASIRDLLSGKRSPAPKAQPDNQGEPAPQTPEGQAPQTPGAPTGALDAQEASPQAWLEPAAAPALAEAAAALASVRSGEAREMDAGQESLRSATAFLHRGRELTAAQLLSDLVGASRS